MHPEWARGLRDQCKAAGVPFLLKQRGEFVLSSEWTSDFIPRGAGRYMVNGTEWLRVGKRAAGRLLDGVTHDEYPEAAP
jgi:protein gp37